MVAHNASASNVTDSLTATDIALTTTFTILVIVNLVSNSLVFVVVFKHRQMRTLMNYLLVNLAVSDIMVAVFIAPQYVLRHFYTHPEGTAGDVLCKLVTGGNFIWTGKRHFGIPVCLHRHLGLLWYLIVLKRSRLFFSRLKR